MTIEEIGTNAGEVWKAISEGNDTLKTIKKATKLKDKEVFAAIGWLAREGKLVLSEGDDPKDFGVALVAE